MNLQQISNLASACDRAKSALDAGLAADALTHAAEACRIDPGCLEARLTESAAWLALQQPIKALAALDAAALHDHRFNDRPDAAALRLRALIAAGRGDAAMSLAATLTRRFPADAGLHRLAAHAAGMVGNADARARHLRRVIDLAPSDVASRRLLAAAIAPADPQAAAAVLAGGKSPRTAADWAQIARWLVAAHRLADAEQLYRALLAERPDDATLWIEAADVAAQLGDRDQSVARYRRAAALHPQGREPIFAALGRTAMRAGDFKEAVRWWFAATRLDPASAEAWASIIACALLLQRPHLIEQASRRLARVADEQERAICLSKAWLNAAGGDVIRRSTQPSPTASPEPASPLNWILHRSTEVLVDQAAARPGWADTLYHTAICQAALGDFLGARENVQAALDINPNYKAATTLAARLPKAA